MASNKFHTSPARQFDDVASYVKQPQDTHRFFPWMIMPSHYYFITKNPWDCMSLEHSKQRSSGKPTPGNHKCNKKRYESCISVLPWNRFLWCWEGFLKSKPTSSLEGLGLQKGGGTRGWGSNVFFTKKSCFFEQIVSLFDKLRLNDRNQKNNLTL